MGKSKKRKGPRPPKPGIIQSDPERVRRAEIAAAIERDYQAWSWQYDSSGQLGARRYNNTSVYNNAGHPYNGGLPGLGKRR